MCSFNTIVTVFDSKGTLYQEAQNLDIFRGIIVFRPTDVVCTQSLNRLDPFLRDLAKSGEIYIDHKVDIDILSFLPNYPIYSLDSTKAFGALRDIVLL